MPPSRLSDQEVRQIQAYLRGLAVRRPAAPAGDAARGETLFRGKGACLRCPIVHGEGGRMGPELTSIGLSRSVARLRLAILDPEAEVPDNFAQYRHVIPMPDNFVMVRVRTRQGRELRGIRLNEDPFSIQLRDLDDQLHSLPKSELAELITESGKSPMPGYRGQLDDAEVDDLVAFLLSLRTPR
jgi:putative heme-binding domain-containing protein